MDTSGQNVCTHPLSSLLRFKMKEKRCTHHTNVHGRETNSREKCTKLTGNETLIKTNAVFHKSEKGTLATRVNFYGMLLF